ncbi:MULTISPECIES: FG-GAP-like repeat-containing protein [unclassified Streptomyces]|uniref:FG-GAP-like repeat-containing protein n=1 Tax=unclassified Streptomyces TaxID=2593676 RepID=UPI0037F2ABB9
MNHLICTWSRARKSGMLAVVAALVSGLLVALPAGPAVAVDWPLASTPLMTWNMQGATDQNESKWNNYVAGYSRRFPIVMLQEAGPAPAENSRYLGGLTRQTVDRTNTPHTHTVHHHRWQPETADGSVGFREIYFLHTQNGVGGRVNLALVVSEDPDEVNVVANPIDAGRTALGVRYGTNWYFTIHGLSGGGGDSAVLLNAIDDEVERWGNAQGIEYNWTVGGDFNVDPRVLQDRAGFPVARAVSTDENTPTHNSGNRYDYFVTDDFNAANSLGDAWLNEMQPPSDHRPVGVGRLRAAADPPSDIRLMPIGDSITEGWGSSNSSGARDEIQDSLGKTTLGELIGTPNGWLIYASLDKRDMVGQLEHGKDIPDDDHEGWAGYTIGQIQEKIDGSVSLRRPNIVTLLAGTNDMVRNVDVGNAPSRLSQLIDKIYEWSPGVTIVVGTLTPSRDDTIQNRINAYNAAIWPMLGRRITNGDHLVRVDLSAVTKADLADVVHPNDAGYDKIAAAFSAGIRTALVNGWVTNPAPSGQQPGQCSARQGYEVKGRIWEGLLGNPDVARSIKYADLDGDGRDDIVWISPTGAATAWLNRNAGGKITWVYRGEIAMGTGLGPDRVFFADLDNDRRDDYIVIRPNNVIDAYYNRGGDTVDKDNWHAGFEPHLNYGRGTNIPVDRIRFADVNGDGRADYIRLVDFSTKIDVWYNRGGDTPGHDGWEEGGAILANLTPRTNQQIEFADLNCDRKADYIALDPNGVPRAWFNTGDKQWAERGQIATGTGGIVAMPELDGDGRADWVRIARNGAIEAWLNKGGD